jgi:hypothetical protein
MDDPQVAELADKDGHPEITATALLPPPFFFVVWRFLAAIPARHPTPVRRGSGAHIVLDTRLAALSHHEASSDQRIVSN